MDALTNAERDVGLDAVADPLRPSEEREALARQLMVELALVEHELRNTTPSSVRLVALHGHADDVVSRLRSQHVLVTPEPRPLPANPPAGQQSPVPPTQTGYHALVAEIGHLEKAVISRTVIGQAEGILMERYKITADQAFNRLRNISQHLNRKLRDVAADLVANGTDPLAPQNSGRAPGCTR